MFFNNRVLSYILFLLVSNKHTTFGFYYDDSWFRASSVTSVSESESPFVASLRDRFNGFYCPASIIGQRWALTTVECVYYLSTHSTVLITGTKSLITGGKASKIEKFVVHPNFTHEKLENDIALVKLEDELEFDDEMTNLIKIDSSPVNANDDDNNLLTYSWGFADHIKASHSTELQKLPLTSLTMQKCLSRLPNFIARLYDKSNTVCARDSNQQQNHQKGTCNIQSGAPVINTRQKTLIAIGSYSRPCAIGFPNMFLKITQYKDWIERIIRT